MGVFKRKHPWDKFYKKNERTIKVPNMSLYELILDANKDNLNGIAINYFGKKITYRQFFAEIDACAKAFIKEGVTPGDVITICMANTPEAVYAFYAASKIGAIASMLHPFPPKKKSKIRLFPLKVLI